MITLYGAAPTRATRSQWMLEELGLEYAHVREPDLASAAFRALNPNGKVPVLVDGDLVLFESLAINLYLARQYPSALWPDAVEDQARALQWSVWALAELEELALVALRHRAMLPEFERDASAARSAEASSSVPLGVLDAALTDRDWLLGDAFTVADLNVASVVILTRFAGFDYTEYWNVLGWLERCFARPAAQRSRA